MVAWVDAASEILNVYFYGLVVLHGSHDDARTFGRMMYRIGEQIRNDPCYLLAVHENLGNLLRIIHFHETAEPFGQYPCGFYCVINQFDRLRNLGMQLQFARFYLRHVEQFARYLQKPVAAVFDALHQLLLFPRSTYRDGRRSTVAGSS